MEGILNKAKIENREMNEEEIKNFDDTEKEIKNIDATLERMDKISKMENKKVEDKKELTQYGANVYKKIREQEFKKISLVDFQINTQKNVYLPKEFLGLSRN